MRPLRTGSAKLWAILATAVSVIIGLLVLWSLSEVRGSEFSPTHFSRRSFYFSSMFGVQLSKIRHSLDTPDMTLYLTANNLIQVPQGKPTRWDLVSIHHLSSSNRFGDPEVLLTYLETNEWEDWSKAHPKAAAVLWSTVQEMALNRLYLIMPGVFEIANEETDAVKLQAKLAAYLDKEIPAFVDDLLAAGETQRAFETTKRAVQKYPKLQGIADLQNRLTAS